MNTKEISQDRIRALKQARNLTDSEFARAAGLSRQHIWKLLNKPLRNPSLRTIEAITKGLNCSVDDLAA